MDKKEFYDTVDGNVKGFSGISWGILPACNAGDSGSVPRMWRSPGGGNGYPLQYSCLENPMHRGAWWATYSPWGHKESHDSNWGCRHIVCEVRDFSSNPALSLTMSHCASHITCLNLFPHKTGKEQKTEREDIWKALKNTSVECCQLR